MAEAKMAYGNGKLQMFAVYVIDAAPVDGTSGTGVGDLEKGTFVFDLTNCNLYVNTGTAASPVWKLFTRAA